MKLRSESAVIAARSRGLYEISELELRENGVVLTIFYYYGDNQLPIA
jgi:hypothetical protein